MLHESKNGKEYSIFQESDVGHHNFTHQRTGVVLFVGNDQYVTPCAEIQCSVKNQIIAGVSFDGVSRNHHCLRLRSADQFDARVHSARQRHMMHE